MRDKTTCGHCREDLTGATQAAIAEHLYSHSADDNAPPAWELGHEDHDTDTVSRSWGETAECNTCGKILAAWNDQDGLLPYIPSGVKWNGSRA